MISELGRSSYSVVRRRSLNCTEEGVGLVRQIVTVCFDQVVRCFASAEIEEERIGNRTTLVKLFSKHVVKVLTDLVEKSLHGQGGAPFFRSVNPSVSRS